MEISGYAFFLQRPRRIKDLLRPHLLEKEKAFTIVQTISLSRIDFENFTSDMTVDREWIEKYGPQCKMEKVWKCLLVRSEKGSGGILVMPEGGRYVGWAAFWREEQAVIL